MRNPSTGKNGNPSATRAGLESRPGLFGYAYLALCFRVNAIQSLGFAALCRTDTTFRDASLADLSLFSISVDPETDRQAWGATAKLASRHQLTLYDAAYLELARRRCLPLATLDRDLRAAAIREDVELLGL